MSTIQAKIAAKKLTESTGVEDKVADQMFHRGEGGHYLAIVDLEFLEKTEGKGEKHIVRLEISQLEILTGPAEDHGRELMRAVYTRRQPEGLDQTDGETPDRIIERGKNTILDPFEYDGPEGVKATVDA